MNEPVRTYKQFIAGMPLTGKLRSLVRDAVIMALSVTRSVPGELNWIRFPYYHHVFDDERSSFEEHLKYMKNLGEFISLDAAVDILESDQPIDGRYFCITLDDAFKNCLTNAMPVLLDYKVPAAFFVPTKYVGLSIESDRKLCCGFFEGQNLLMEFLSWDDLKRMAGEGMTIGSHTVSHARLVDLSDEEVESELKQSKATIESELGLPCDHFCCPIGIPGVDFHADREPQIAKRLGYRSFLTTRRGSVHRKSTPMHIDRDHTLAAWKTYQLRYFFSL